MPFRYRLQKFLEIRIRKKEEQLQEVIKAQAEVDRIELLIIKNNREIQDTRVNMRKSDPMMYDGFDKFLKHLIKKVKNSKKKGRKPSKPLRLKKKNSGNAKRK